MVIRLRNHAIYCALFRRFEKGQGQSIHKYSIWIRGSTAALLSLKMTRHFLRTAPCIDAFGRL